MGSAGRSGKGWKHLIPTPPEDFHEAAPGWPGLTRRGTTAPVHDDRDRGSTRAGARADPSGAADPQYRRERQPARPEAADRDGRKRPGRRSRRGHPQLQRVLHVEAPDLPFARRGEGLHRVRARSPMEHRPRARPVRRQRGRRSARDHAPRVPGRVQVLERAGVPRPDRVDAFLQPHPRPQAPLRRQRCRLREPSPSRPSHQLRRQDPPGAPPRDQEPVRRYPLRR